MPLVPADCDKRPNSQSCSPWYIARRLGQGDRSPEWILRQIGALIAHEGFPPPIVLYSCTMPRRPEKMCGLTTTSRWQLGAVDGWFAGQDSAFLPAEIAERAAGAADRALAAELDARANALAAGAQA